MKRLIVGLFCLLTLTAGAQETSETLRTFENLQKLIVEVSNRIKPAVVHVEVLHRRGELRHKGLGSGLVIKSDGTIVTNQHVIDRAERITVILDDKSKHEARVLRQDRQTDLALLKIEAGRPLQVANLGNSDEVSVGEWVLAIGNPYGFDRTVSFGIVSGKGRYIPDSDNGIRLLNDFIQTDALIDPGSSGGPLVDLHGDVIGINSVGIGRGQGFTIPARVVKEVITRPQVEGRLQRGWIGVYLQPLNRELATYFKIPDQRGALISDVVAGSPAAQAGLKTGDILITLNTEPVEAEQDEEINRLAQQVTGLNPGQTVPVTVLREGKKVELKLLVGQQPRLDARELDLEFGALVKEITPAQVQEYRLLDNHGVVVSLVTSGSAADEAGLEDGDVVLAVDGTAVSSLDALESLMAKLRSQSQILFKVRRGSLLRYALVERTHAKKP